LIPRTVRTKRVREARDEAKKEIEAYRQAKEEEFKKFEAEVRSGPFSVASLPLPFPHSTRHNHQLSGYQHPKCSEASRNSNERRTAREQKQSNE